MGFAEDYEEHKGGSSYIVRSQKELDDALREILDESLGAFNNDFNKGGMSKNYVGKNYSIKLKSDSSYVIDGYDFQEKDCKRINLRNYNDDSDLVIKDCNFTKLKVKEFDDVIIEDCEFIWDYSNTSIQPLFVSDCKKVTLDNIIINNTGETRSPASALTIESVDINQSDVNISNYESNWFYTGFYIDRSEVSIVDSSVKKMIRGFVIVDCKVMIKNSEVDEIRGRVIDSTDSNVRVEDSISILLSQL